MIMKFLLMYINFDEHSILNHCCYCFDRFHVTGAPLRQCQAIRGHNKVMAVTVECMSPCFVGLFVIICVDRRHLQLALEVLH